MSARSRPAISGFAFDQALPDLQATGVPAGWSCDAAQVSGGTTSLACNAPTLAADASAAFTLEATATAATLPATLTMAAAATAETDDPDASNNEAEAMLEVTPPQADLSIAMQRTGVTTGVVANFRVPVANAGPDAAAGVHVVITGNVGGRATLAQPPGWTCRRIAGATMRIECDRAAAMPSGGRSVIAFSVMVPRTQSLQFDASVDSDTQDPDSGNNAAGYAKP